MTLGMVLVLVACGAPSSPLPRSSAETHLCTGNWQAYCDAGLTYQACCPHDAACSLVERYLPCGDGTCVTSPAQCAPDVPEACTGEWRSVCTDGVPQSQCCFPGRCPPSGAFQMCEDGLCSPLGVDCDSGGDVCNGEMLDVCLKGRVSTLCCPEDWRCLSADPFINCGGGVCVGLGNTCQL